MSLLETLNLPDDLKNMTDEDRKVLAEEIRERIMEVVMRNGGHLASNLGVVELTIALYSVYDPFKDRIIWDVGHQSYVHKLLTGRNSEFDTIRCKDGLCGFPVMTESKADAFGVGHSSTSISAALGMARARDMLGQDHKVVAVIGDGAFTGGMALEGLNDAGGQSSNMLVILNDNGMSISRNVGGMARYLGKIRTGTSYIRLKKGVKSVLGRIPFIGSYLVRGVQKFKNFIKKMVIPGELFEFLGMEYVGPVNGHSIKEITRYLKKAMYIDGPVLMHVITQKGNGYEPAEQKPSEFHGVAPSGPDQCVNSFSKNLGEVLCRFAKDDDKIAVICAAMSEGTGLKRFYKEYPERFFDVGIAEQHAVTMAAGMAACGIRVYVALYSTFLQRAYDQLLHDCALQKLPVVITLDRAGASGPDGKTHQGIYDIAFVRSMPGVAIAAPCSVDEQTALLELSRNTDCPFVIRYPGKEKYCNKLPSVEYRWGKGYFIYEKAECDVCIIALGPLVREAMKAKEILEEKGISVNVFNALFASPMDQEGIEQACKLSKYVVICEDGLITGGFGEGVVCMLQKLGISKKVDLLGYPDGFVEHATIEEIYDKYGLSGCGIADFILKRGNGS